MSENTSTEKDFAMSLSLIFLKKFSWLTIGSLTSRGFVNEVVARCGGNSSTAPAPKRMIVGKLYCRIVLKSVMRISILRSNFQTELINVLRCCIQLMSYF